MKVGIVGSRDFGDLTRVDKLVDFLFDHYGSDLTIASGGAAGVDRTAVSRAKKHGAKPWQPYSPVGFYYKEFFPKEGENFATAALARNTEIIDFSNDVYAFWSMSPKSRGTIDSMYKAILAGKLTRVFVPKGNFLDVPSIK